MIQLTAKMTSNPVNQCGLIAGALGGENIVLIVLANTLILNRFSSTDMVSSHFGVNAWIALYPFLIIALFEGWGIFAAWLGWARFDNRTGAFLAGFITGILMGILLEVMWIARIISMVSHQFGSYTGFFMGYGGIILTGGTFIVLVIMGGVLSGFGSYIFYMAKHPETT
jgi:hypothetical protein